MYTQILTNLANAGLKKHEFKSAIQMIGRCRPQQDSEFLAAAVAGSMGGMTEDKVGFENRRIVKDNMKQLLDQYSRPDYISKDYQILVSAYPSD